MGANQLVPKRPPTFMMGGSLGWMGATQASGTTTPSSSGERKVSQNRSAQHQGPSGRCVSDDDRAGLFGARSRRRKGSGLRSGRLSKGGQA